jgi:hypothetical protein
LRVYNGVILSLLGLPSICPFVSFIATTYYLKLLGLFHLNIPGSAGTSLISDPLPSIKRRKRIHPPPSEFTSINTPLPLERKKNHKNNFLYRNTQS